MIGFYANLNGVEYTNAKDCLRDAMKMVEEVGDEIGKEIMKGVDKLIENQTFNIIETMNFLAENKGYIAIDGDGERYKLDKFDDLVYCDNEDEVDIALNFVNEKFKLVKQEPKEKWEDCSYTEAITKLFQGSRIRFIDNGVVGYSYEVGDGGDFLGFMQRFEKDGLEDMSWQWRVV